MDIILIPGLWLDGASWEKVVPVLEQAGHRLHRITFPGMESRDADRTGITLRDMLRTWIEQGEQPVGQSTKIRYVDCVELPTGHWPQLTRPEELGRAILDSIEAPLIVQLCYDQPG
jgi:pimeloyl-ACP methyl ester carboxylesterase